MLIQLHEEVFGDSGNAAVADRPPGGADIALDDEAVVALAASAKNGAKFRALWDGDWSTYPSQSEGDLALCSLLAFWADQDPSRIDRLFRRSGLFRPKWDEQRGERTYGEIAIAKVIDESRPAARRSPLRVQSRRPSTYPRTDSGNAELYAHLYGGQLRFDHRRGRWLKWRGHWWSPDDNGLPVRRAKELARERIRGAADVEDSDDRKAEANWGLASESRHRIEATLALARNELTIADTGEHWDTDPWVLGAGNGVVDLGTGTLRPGRPDDRILLHTDVPYKPESQCPRFRLFLAEIFEGDLHLVDFVHRALGYSITGDTREQVVFICHGTGANGKGVLLNTVARVLGSYAHNLPFQSLEKSRQYSIPTDLADLVGRRFVTASETSESATLNEARIKALTGQDPITARFLHQNFFTFNPVAKFWLAVNHWPKVTDESYGFWRRVRLVPFNVVFVSDHPRGPACGPDHRHAEQDLDDRLRGEKEGILAWLVEGAIEWQRRGLEPPEAVSEATSSYREEADPLGDFLAECCVAEPGCSARSRDLFGAYRDWAEREGLRGRDVLTHATFGRRLTGRFEKRRGNQGVVYQGIGLISESHLEGE